MDLLLFLPVLVFSVICHEVAHGLVALRFGDETALRDGRLTLNPLPHIDPVGSIIFPTICALLHFPIFGWAKPVPVNPNRFSSYRAGVIWVSLAGPLTNMLLAVIFAGFLYLSVAFGFLSTALLQRFVSQAVLLNLVLAVFNLIPIPPMDGSKIMSAVLPYELSQKYDQLEPYGFFIVMALIATGVLGKILYPAVEFLYRIILQVVWVH